MDFLLKGEELKFSIDEIYKKNDNLYCVKIIPEIKSEYFPPYHTREINIDKMLLEKKFYYAYNKKLEFYDNIQNRENVDEKYIKDESVFQGSVVQGGYYSIKTSNIRDIGIFKKDTIITSQNDIFKGNKIESPYDNVATNNNILKIDKGFVKDIISNKRAQIIIGMMTRMCSEMGIQLVAEGIEDGQQFEVLREYGVKTVQGYLFSRPVSISEYEEKYMQGL